MKTAFKASQNPLSPLGKSAVKEHPVHENCLLSVSKSSFPETKQTPKAKTRSQKMSHRKVHSQGSIPFSWEDKPGVSKVFTNQDDNCPAELAFHALSFLSDQDQQYSGDSPKPKVSESHEIKIPPPPCPISRAPSRSSSTKGLRWQAEPDPFLLAFKECTKSASTLNYDSGKLGSENNKKIFGLIRTGVKKSRFSMFSCKSSCGVRDDNLVKLSQLSPLPRDTSRSFG